MKIDEAKKFTIALMQHLNDNGVFENDNDFKWACIHADDFLDELKNGKITDWTTLVQIIPE